MISLDNICVSLDDDVGTAEVLILTSGVPLKARAYRRFRRSAVRFSGGEATQRTVLRPLKVSNCGQGRCLSYVGTEGSGLNSGNAERASVQFQSRRSRHLPKDREAAILVLAPQPLCTATSDLEYAGRSKQTELTVAEMWLSYVHVVQAIENRTVRRRHRVLSA